MVCVRVEGALERLQDVGDVAVEVAYFARGLADQLGFVGREVREFLCPFRLDDLEFTAC